MAGRRVIRNTLPVIYQGELLYVYHKHKDSSELPKKQQKPSCLPHSLRVLRGDLGGKLVVMPTERVIETLCLYETVLMP